MNQSKDATAAFTRPIPSSGTVVNQGCESWSIEDFGLLNTGHGDGLTLQEIFELRTADLDALRINLQEATGHGRPPNSRGAWEHDWGEVTVGKNSEATKLSEGRAGVGCRPRRGSCGRRSACEVGVCTARGRGDAREEPWRQLRQIQSGELGAYFLYPPLLTPQAEKGHMSPGRLLVATAAGINFLLLGGGPSTTKWPRIGVNAPRNQQQLNHWAWQRRGAKGATR